VWHIFYFYFLKQCDIEIGKTKQDHCIIDIEKIAVHSYYKLRRKSDYDNERDKGGQKLLT